MKSLCCLFCCLFLLSGKAFTSPLLSGEEFIKQLRDTGQLGVFDSPTAELFNNLCQKEKCLKNRHKKTNDLKFLCEVILASEMCKETAKDDLLNCKNPYESKEFDTVHFFAGCIGGVFDYAKEMLSFVWGVVKWTYEKGLRSETYKGAYKEAAAIMDGAQLYLAREYRKAYLKSSEP